MFTVVAVGHYPGDGAHEEWGQQPHDKKGAHCQARFAQDGDQRRRGNQVKPVAHPSDRLAEPEEAEVRVVTKQFAVSD